MPPAPGRPLSGRKLGKLLSTKEQEQFSEQVLFQEVKAILGQNNSGIDEIQNLLQKIEALMETSDKTKRNFLNNQAFKLRYQLQLVINSLVFDRNNEASKDIVQLSFENYDTLMTMPDRSENLKDARVSEIYGRLAATACHFGLGFQKRKMFTEGLGFCERFKTAYDLWESTGSYEFDSKVNTSWVTLIKAECLGGLGRQEDGLAWLAERFAMDSRYWETPNISYDIFGQVMWDEVSTHWMRLYKDAWNFRPEFNKTSLDFLDTQFLSSLDQETISKILRLEFNAHFTTRFCVPSGLIAVGEALIEKSASNFDNILGYLGVAIGASFGSPDQVNFGFERILDAAKLIEEDPFFSQEQNSDATAFLSALISIWRGLVLLKIHQFFAENELVALREQYMAGNPEKYKDRETGEDVRGISGLSSLNLGHERDWVCSIVQGIEILFRFTVSEEVLKGLCNEYCPAMALSACRMSSSILIAIGDSTHGVKAWHVVNKLAKIYDRKGLMVLSASEILKIIPDLKCEAVVCAEEALTVAIKENLIKHNHAISYRLPLAKSVACYNLKMYAEGVQYLLEVFDYLSTRDYFDASLHLLADTIYVFSLYRAKHYTHSIDLSGFPESYVKLSLAGLATRSFKILAGLTRDLDVINSGWTDLLHNYYLLGSIFDVGTYTMRVLRESGKTRELKYFLSDLVHFAQHCGFVSRSVAFVVPTIAADISARNFMHAQMKVDAIFNVYNVSSCPPETDHEEKSSYEKVVENLKLPLISIKRLESMNGLKWALESLKVPSFCYKNRKDKVTSALKKDLRPDFEKTEFCFPSWMRHHLSCACYVCSHKDILPTAFEFFHNVAKYLNCQVKAKGAMAILETTKLCHERSIFRIIYNLSLIGMPLSVIGSTTAALKAVENLYTQFCVGPGIDAMMTQMMICPVSDIKMILSAMRKATKIIETLDPKDYIGKAFPLEMGFAALYKFLITTGQVQVTGSEVRSILENKLKSLKKENTNAVSPIPTGLQPSSMGPPRKGILKVKAERVKKTDADIDDDDDRPKPHVSKLQWENDDNECSSSSSSDWMSDMSERLESSLSLSGGQPQAAQLLQPTLKTPVTRPRRVVNRR